MLTTKQSSSSEESAKEKSNKPFFSKHFVQAKLQVNEPGDSYEREADAMADHVMRGGGHSSTPKSFFKSVGDGIQRKCQHCEEEEKLIHRKESSGNGAQGSDHLDNYVSSLGSSGTPLPEASREFFEPRFGQDFSNVRVHNDSVAAKSAQSINALAYTTGNNIVFNHGQYAPDSESGKKLMAHELTHVVQQKAGKSNMSVQRNFAIEPQGLAAGVTERGLSEKDIKDAIQFNKSVFGSEDAIKTVKSIIGADATSAAIDREFVLVVAKFQADEGIAQDGKVGEITMMIILEEVKAEKKPLTAQKIKSGYQIYKPLDINASHCGCQQELRDAIDGNNFFIPLYQKCENKPGVTNGTKVEQCVDAEANSVGVSPVIVGTTSASSGAINVPPVPGKCGKLLQTDTLAHEQVHHVHEKELEQAHGAGTPEFNTAANDPHDWVNDELNARKTETVTFNFMIQALDSLCGAGVP